MIIPVRCFTCGKVLADKHEYFKRRCAELDQQQQQQQSPAADQRTTGTVPMPALFEASNKGRVLDELELRKICCRRHMLGQVDLMEAL